MASWSRVNEKTSLASPQTASQERIVTTAWRRGLARPALYHDRRRRNWIDRVQGTSFVPVAARTAS